MYHTQIYKKVFLLTLSEMILTMNFFKYLDSYYLQSQGAAMGSAFAPSYACLVMVDGKRSIHPYNRIYIWTLIPTICLLLWNNVTLVLIVLTLQGKQQY